MPIYEYRCRACGYQNDYLQKISDPLLSDCPDCGKSTFEKQVTAAGFQLKGTGWYVTDFKNNGSSKPATPKPKPESKAGSDSGTKASDTSSSSSETGSKSETSAGGTGASTTGS